MFKKGIFVFLIVFVFAVNLLVFPALAAPENVKTTSSAKEKSSAFDLKAKAATLIDATSGKVLFEKNMNEKLPIASVTKVMSMLLIMEAVDSGKIKLEDMVPVSEHSYNMGGSQVYLKPGEQFTVNELLKAVAVHSANDATVALGEFVAGGEDLFVAKMNEKSKALGMQNTNFLDCTGLTDEGHYSSAYDVALMSKELITKHPKILEYTSIWHDTFRDGKFSLDNTNKLIRFYQGSNGLKTGFTTIAGHCLSAAAKRNNMQLISVVLGEPDSDTRFAESKKLLDFGFANYEIVEVNKKGQEVNIVPVKKGLKSEVKTLYGEDAKLLLSKDEKGKVSREIKVDTDITAPIKAAQKVGEVIYKVGDKEVGKTIVVADSDIEKASTIRLFFRMVLQWFGVGKA